MKRMNLTQREQELVLALRQEAAIHNHALAEAIKVIESYRASLRHCADEKLPEAHDACWESMQKELGELRKE